MSPGALVSGEHKVEKYRAYGRRPEKTNQLRKMYRSRPWCVHRHFTYEPSSRGEMVIVLKVEKKVCFANGVFVNPETV